MNMFYGFEFEFDGEKLSGPEVVSDEFIYAIPPEKYSVGVIPIVVKCTHCNEHMLLKGREENVAEVGEFVCESCGRRIWQYYVFKKIGEDVKDREKKWESVPKDRYGRPKLCITAVRDSDD